MLNLLLLCGVAVVAYILTALFEVIIGMLSTRELKRAKKKRLQNDLYRFKLKQLYLFTVSYYIEIGYTKARAQRTAINIISKLDDELLIDNKYQLLRNAQREGAIYKIS